MLFLPAHPHKSLQVLSSHKQEARIRHHYSLHYSLTHCIQATVARTFSAARWSQGTLTSTPSHPLTPPLVCASNHQAACKVGRTVFVQFQAVTQFHMNQATPTTHYNVHVIRHTLSLHIQETDSERGRRRLTFGRRRMSVVKQTWPEEGLGLSHYGRHI